MKLIKNLKTLFKILLSATVIMLLYFIYIFNVDIKLNTNIEISKGQSLKSIVYSLENKYPYYKLLYYYFRIKGGANSVRPGKVYFKGNYDIKSLYKEILEQKRELKFNTFTILPGERYKELKNNIKNIFDIKDIEDVFNKYKSKYVFLKEFKNLEGIIAPDTYYINKESKKPLEEFLDLAFKRFENRFYTEYLKKEIKKSFLDVCILASIVEREGRTYSEKRKMAGVFINRLNRGQLIESCATVQYLFNEPKKRLSYKDIAVVSPYNTYINKGLPPTPICYFSESSFQSVLNYEKHNYYYFVLKNDGSHHFSKTLNEHNRWKKKLK